MWQLWLDDFDKTPFMFGRCRSTCWTTKRGETRSRDRTAGGYTLRPVQDMFIVLLDEPGLFVFRSPADAVQDIEPPDAESVIRAAFDDDAVPYRVDWIRPNQYTRLLGVVKYVSFGEYRFLPAGPADPDALVALLEAHPDFTDPPEAAPALASLLTKMRAR